MAAPLVAGTVALVEAAHPTWSMSQVIDAVLDTTTPDPKLVGKVTTGGIVNAAAAVANTDGPYVVSSTPSGSIGSGTGLSTIQVTFNEEINPATFTPSQVTLSGPGGTITGVSVAAVAGSNDHTFAITFPTQSAAGTYTLKVGPDIQDWYGNDLDQNRNGVNGEATADAVRRDDRTSRRGSSDVLVVSGSLRRHRRRVQFLHRYSDDARRRHRHQLRGHGRFHQQRSAGGGPANQLSLHSASNNGTHLFSVSFKTAGMQSITATERLGAGGHRRQGNILVQPATAKSIRVQ